MYVLRTFCNPIRVYIIILEMYFCLYISHLCRKGKLLFSLNSGPPLLIQPTDRKVFHVAEGQRIKFVISIASSPSPKQHLTVSRANMEQKRNIDVEFYRTERSTLKAVVVPLAVPLYSADVRLTNITSSWTGNYILFVNNSHGYVTYNFSVDVVIQEKGDIFCKLKS